MKTVITSIACASLCAASVHAAGFHTDFTEASLAAVAGLGKDAPGAPSADLDLNAGADTLDFTVDNGFNADMWGNRNNAPIAWVANPGVGNGQTWSVETYLAMEKDGSNNQEVAGITFYSDADGAKPAFTFGIDDWNGWNVRLQGLGNNIPNVGGPDLGIAPGAFLRVEITENGASDTYNFFYKLNQGDGWMQLGGVATNFVSDVDNSRAGLFLKSDSSGGGGAQFDYLTVTPEPSSLVLVGLGGLLIARRRRG